MIPSNVNGLFLVGDYVGEELSKPVMTKAGTMYQFKTVAIKLDSLQNVLVEVPVDYKVSKDKDGRVSLPVRTSAKTWDNIAKRFMFVNVKFYIPKS